MSDETEITKVGALADGFANSAINSTEIEDDSTGYVGGVANGDNRDNTDNSVDVDVKAEIDVAANNGNNRDNEYDWSYKSDDDTSTKTTTITDSNNDYDWSYDSKSYSDTDTKTITDTDTKTVTDTDIKTVTETDTKICLRQQQHLRQLQQDGHRLRRHRGRQGLQPRRCRTRPHLQSRGRLLVHSRRRQHPQQFADRRRQRQRLQRHPGEPSGRPG